MLTSPVWLLAALGAAHAEDVSGPEPTWKLALKLPTLKQAQQTASSERCRAALAPAVASAFTKAVYDAVLELQVAAPGEFQREVFRLRDQEYPYYHSAYQDRLPRVPDLSDASGGLSNPTYFNFIYYILWKVACSKVGGQEQRARLQRVAGRRLLEALAPEALAQVAPGPTGAGPSEQVLTAAVDLLMSNLQAGGYCCEYQIVWGYTGGELPRNWFLERGGVVGQDPSSGPAAGSAFQIRVHQPADIEGAVALRGEEDGFWAAALSSMVLELLQAAGLAPEAQDEFFFQDDWGGPRGWRDRVLMVFGDPLQQVEVPWQPSSLVFSWQLAAGAAG